MMPWSRSTTPACKQRREREDDRGWVAAGVGDEPGGPDGVAVQLRAAIDRLRLQLRSEGGVGVRQAVDGTVVCGPAVAMRR